MDNKIFALPLRPLVVVLVREESWAGTPDAALEVWLSTEGNSVRYCLGVRPPTNVLLCVRTTWMLPEEALCFKCLAGRAAAGFLRGCEAILAEGRGSRGK